MIVSLGANKKRILAVLVLIAIAVSAFFLIPRGEKRQTFPGMTGEERLAFLTSFGWEAEAEPQDMRDQPWFANQVLKVSCALDMTAPDFLDMLLDVEKRLGRVRETSDPAMRFGPRVIDLDLLLFDQERWDTPHLALPHPRMSERAFVLVPLRDIEPNLLLSDGRTPGEALRSLAHAVEGNRIRQ